LSVEVLTCALFLRGVGLSAVLLCLLHALPFAASLRLPLSIDKTTAISTAEEEPKILEMAE
jgi:hypothetical protein